jgi:hypothetical protein
VERCTLSLDRDHPLLHEYLKILGGIVSRLYGLSASHIDKLLPGVRPKDLGLV